MKITQLLSGIHLILTNEEKNFVSSHQDKIKVKNLDDHSLWVAQNLVRKGAYIISNDSQFLIKNIND
jgi:hypothetical protein